MQLDLCIPPIPERVVKNMSHEFVSSNAYFDNFLNEYQESYDSILILTGAAFSKFNYGWEENDINSKFNNKNLKEQYALLQRGNAGVC